MGRYLWFVFVIFLGAFGFERAEHAVIAGSMENLKPPARPNALHTLLHPPPLPPPPPPPPAPSTVGGAMP